MFQILDKPVRKDNAIFNDDTLQSVLNELERYEKKPKSLFKQENKWQLSDVLKPLSISNENLVNIENRSQELQEDLSNLDEDIALQTEVLVSSQEMIREHDKTYMEAIINNDTAVIDQMKENIKECKDNIHYAEIRQQAYQIRKDNIQQALKHIESMKGYVKRGLMLIELEDSKKEYQVHLQNFIEQFKTHKQRVDAVGYEYFGNKRETEAKLLGEIVKGIGFNHLF